MLYHTAEPYAKRLFLSCVFILFFGFACQDSEDLSSDNGVKISTKLSDNHHSKSSKLNFAQVRALFSDLIYLAECIKRDSISNHSYQDSAHAIGIMLLMQKYQIDSSELRATLDEYLSNIDTGLFLLRSVQYFLKKQEQNLQHNFEKNAFSDSMMLKKSEIMDTEIINQQQLKPYTIKKSIKH